MKDADQMRVWALLTRVRRLRVQRARRVVSEARLGVERAAADTEWQRDAIAQHEARRGEILTACSFGSTGALLWRTALRRHDSGKFALESALSVACHAEQMAQEQVVSALHVLQREMQGQDYAQERVRVLVAARLDDSDSDD